RSACTPLFKRTLDFVAPWARTLSTMACLTKNCDTVSGWRVETRKSRSPLITPAHTHAGDFGETAKSLQHVLSVARDIANPEPARVFLPRLDGDENIVGGLFSKAREGGNAPVFAGCLECFHGGDIELFPHGLDLLRAEPLQLGDLENSGRELRLQRF